MRKFVVWYMAFVVVLCSGLGYGQNRFIKRKGIRRQEIKRQEIRRQEVRRQQLYNVNQPHLKLNVERGKSWIEIELVDEDDQPVQGERYRIELPDGTVSQGTLDSKGQARIVGIDPGTCKITFPNLDKDAWERE